MPPAVMIDTAGTRAHAAGAPLERMGIVMPSVRLFVVGAAAIATTASIAASPAPVPRQPLALSDADAGMTKSITVGDTVAITLPEQPSTGYSWGITWATGGFVEPQPALHKAPSGGGAGRRVGGAGSVTYFLKVAEPGVHAMTFRLNPPGTGDAAPARTFVITFNTAP